MYKWFKVKKVKYEKIVQFCHNISYFLLIMNKNFFVFSHLIDIKEQLFSSFLLKNILIIDVNLAKKEEEFLRQQPDVMNTLGEWGDDERERAPTEFEKENPNILMLNTTGDFKNM